MGRTEILAAGLNLEIPARDGGDGLYRRGF